MAMSPTSHLFRMWYTSRTHRGYDRSVREAFYYSSIDTCIKQNRKTFSRAYYYIDILLYLLLLLVNELLPALEIISNIGYLGFSNNCICLNKCWLLYKFLFQYLPIKDSGPLLVLWFFFLNCMTRFLKLKNIVWQKLNFSYF